MRHHGEALRKLTKDPSLVERVGDDPQGAALEPRERALVDFALRLTATPGRLTEDDLAPLRSVGLSDAGIHDLVSVTAYFNFVNRMALGLGVELEDEYRT
jgi:uncharacterized peroxidase-related enzyme